MSNYPIILNNLETQPVVVVGGGAIAEDKVRTLLEAGAGRVTVISPDLTPALSQWAAGGEITWFARGYQSGDVSAVFLCIAATDSPTINHLVAEEARRTRALVNTVDDPPFCDFYAASVIRQGDFTISIGTGGQMPALAARLRQKLSRGFGPEYGQLIQLMRRLRPSMSLRFPQFEERKQAWYALADAPLIPLLRRGAGEEEIWQRIEQVLQEFERSRPARHLAPVE